MKVNFTLKPAGWYPAISLAIGGDIPWWLWMCREFAFDQWGEDSR
jgi:hypothetical protein